MNELIELVNSKILAFSGLNVAESQIPALTALIKQLADEKGMSASEFCTHLAPDTPEFDEIIRLVTVNETYFFREELQFDFLKEHVFPRFKGKNLTIWSCCCSTGEEPISLLALALSMDIDLTIFASDIDEDALATLREGRYSAYSLRVDGQKYHKLLEPYYVRTENELVFKSSFLSRIETFKYNLLRDTQLPFFFNVDIIFMRNVFIFFDTESRILVTKKVTERLKNDGLLFFSMNEIGSIDDKIIPKNIYKTNCGAVYFFKKGVKPGKKERPAKVANDTAKVANAPAEPAPKTVSKATETKKASAFDSKSTYEAICKEINEGDFSKARTTARAISGMKNKKYSFFMLGYVEYYADNRAAAETLFASAESLDGAFWPAVFYHGIVLRDLGKTEPALRCFAKCKELISGFGQEVPYDFALDSFSPSYIFSLCETFSREESVK